MIYFIMLTPHGQLVETLLHIGKWTQGHVHGLFCGILCGPRKIPARSTWTTLRITALQLQLRLYSRATEVLVHSRETSCCDH